ncbi:hypothetical protein ACFFX0_25635 [Citricoccus parietis]|uniref:Uncharacterized protein n=1 Tax=Citricoccus parietis TaxID=592307 RepID=A0ABV5G611_9MICC
MAPRLRTYPLRSLSCRRGPPHGPRRHPGHPGESAAAALVARTRPMPGDPFPFPRTGAGPRGERGTPPGGTTSCAGRRAKPPVAGRAPNDPR